MTGKPATDAHRECHQALMPNGARSRPGGSVASAPYDG